MISHCANPDCGVPFHYLRGGRLFRFDVKPPSAPCQDVPNAICSQKPSFATVYFWLCKNCCSRLSLKFDPVNGVSLKPMSDSMPALGEAPVIVERSLEDAQ